MAMSAATLPLRRRLIGSLIVIAGALVVLVGFFMTLSQNAAAAPSTSTVLIGGQALSLTGGGGTAADALRHLTDHSLARETTVQTIADLAFRGGIVAMAGAALVSVLLLLGPARGLIGLMAGAGLLGLALCTAVTTGESAAISTASGLHVDVGSAAVVVLALGFAVILAGGAVAALRPLAGLFSGIGLAVVGAGLGIVLALVVGGDHLTTTEPVRQGGSSLLLPAVLP